MWKQLSFFSTWIIWMCMRKYNLFGKYTSICIDASSLIKVDNIFPFESNIWFSVLSVNTACWNLCNVAWSPSKFKVCYIVYGRSVIICNGSFTGIWFKSSNVMPSLFLVYDFFIMLYTGSRLVRSNHVHQWFGSWSGNFLLIHEFIPRFANLWIIWDSHLEQNKMLEKYSRLRIS